MAPRSVGALSPEQLSELTTERLLAYHTKLQALEDRRDLSDWSDEELAALDPARLWFKEDPAWQATHAAMTAILATREHVDRSR